jgi:hypothetical protein
LTRENYTIKNPNILEGTLAYMSPKPAEWTEV